MIFLELDEFQKELKFLQKKYRSLLEDLEVLKLVLGVFPTRRENCLCGALPQEHKRE